MVSSQPLDTVVFDFHGTITDHNMRLVEALRLAFEGTGIDSAFYLALISGLGTNRRPQEKLEDYMRRVAVEADRADWGGCVDRLIENIHQHYDEIYIPVDGLRETISRLQDQGVRIVFFTNGSIEADGAPKHLWPDAASYSDIIYDLLVNQWAIYPDPENPPLVVSARDDMIFRPVRAHTEREVRSKPDPRLANSLGTIIVATLGGDIDFEHTLFLGDYVGDAELAGAAHAHCAYHLKGFEQLIAGITPELVKANGNGGSKLYPYYHISEVPYITVAGGELDRAVYIVGDKENPEGVYVEATFNGELMYSVHLSFIDFGRVRFSEVRTPAELREMIEVERERREGMQRIR